MIKEFFSSETLRSFYSTAKSRGWIDEQRPVLEKTASAQSLDPTDNLLVDLCRLADALRAKGYVKRAESLEACLINYKTAEKHLYNVHDEDGPDFLEFAHPEGDFKVEDAKDGNGTVETLLNSHKKIIDVVKKEPTGKLSFLASSILKNAQVTNSVATINNDIESLIASLHVEELGENGKSIYQLTPEMVLSWYANPEQYKTNIDLFTKKYPQIAQSVEAYAARERKVYGNGTRNFLTISQYIQDVTNTLMTSQASKDLIAYGRLINSNGAYDKYFTGAQPGLIDVDIIRSVVKNPESIWQVSEFDLDGIDTDDTQIGVVAKAMDADMMNQRKQIFMSLPGVNGAIASFFNKTSENLRSFIVPPEQVNESDKAEYVQHLKPISSYTVPNGREYKEIVELISMFGKSPAEYQTASVTLNQDASDLISAGTKQAEGQFQVTLTRFEKAIALFNAAAAKNPGTSGYRENAARTNRIIQIFQNNSSDLSKLASELQKVVGVFFKNFAAIDQFSIDWLNGARQLTGMNAPESTAQRTLELDELPTERTV